MERVRRVTTFSNVFISFNFLYFFISFNFLYFFIFLNSFNFFNFFLSPFLQKNGKIGNRLSFRFSVGLYILLMKFGNFLCGYLSFFCVFVYGLPLFVSLYAQSSVIFFSFFY